MSLRSNVLLRLLREDSGQDLIEYGILTAVISVASLALLVVIRAKMSGAYTTWGGQVNDARFHPNDPITPYP